jgi:hypothetical protein
MTPLRQRMVEDMRVRNLAANTQRAYLQQVSAFAKHFGRSPATLGPEEIRAWQLHLVEVRQLSRSTLVTARSRYRRNLHGNHGDAMVEHLAWADPLWADLECGGETFGDLFR